MGGMTIPPVPTGSSYGLPAPSPSGPFGAPVSPPSFPPSPGYTPSALTSFPKAPQTNALLGIGAVSSLAGAVMGTVGAYYGAKNSKLRARQEALAADFQASMAARNARMAELDAQTARDAGKAELRALGMQYGQAAGQQRVQQAAAGVDMNSGNALEQRVSLRLAQRLDALTIQRNTATAVSGRQTQATNFRNEAAMGRVSARNLRSTAGSINPAASSFAALLDGASRAAVPAYLWSRN